ncbi:DNA-binding protein HU-beta [Candidatus Portiera aleyrodidarum]|uniref:HU family DNA-binding protein n=1 Tax=Candidatus Portiera aleyrodidarum TaxID=91844 RepID=UPI0005D83601|nr:HU family DNA-binding protein [Candidatus Portiera aleyrodidarum]CEL12453.1 DNA-binding protein HU-beta [Candidatus Portiera aleyrodidarum]
MKKSYLRKLISLLTNIKKNKANLIINLFYNYIKKNLKKGKSVFLLGFGTFTIKYSEAKISNNPKNGKKIKLLATKKIKFKISKYIKKIRKIKK